MPPSTFVRMACVLGAVVLSASSVRVEPARAREIIEISAERFTFTPSEVKVKMGVPLEIRLRSEDTDHGFRIVGTKTDVRIPKRNKGVATVMFEPPAAGRYTFECSHVCGAGHSFMRGAIVVSE